MEILTLLFALLIGLVLGLTGAGGSILTVPLFTYLMKYDVITATAYSLFVVSVSSAVGAIKNYRTGNIHIKGALSFAIPSIVMVSLTRALFVPLIPEVIFKIGSYTLFRQNMMLGIFAVFMIYAGYKMLQSAKLEETILVIDKKHSVKLAVLGVILGATIGFLGAGGGFMIVPALVLLARMTMKNAVGTSLLLISLNSGVGFLSSLDELEGTDWGMLIKFSALMIIGIVVGGIFEEKINAAQLKKGFAVLVFIVAAWIIYLEFFML
ncbi:MAG: sulfite exporter TauE/SafE family protein [Ignavibacteriales bacterium]|nr:MAG: sulfite exporter TauE/SafE family protein [Ignavibacteriaceae bacterium]MBW7871989.1 sulfite exporter TauE/SafE family protein [Ignavibacteria bacterium]MCZ2144084.1 sulfite exporter TauE/SafE family protein [Ignavibacteriales bacterium]OQY76338.1 MAG: hypothetical protein B6D45_03890 [Ignavibacteriales bacterium UTCHB3]MBV6446115.1 hypothetical protein [Ignavibacteriaceae bacterium]